MVSDQVVVVVVTVVRVWIWSLAGTGFTTGFDNKGTFKVDILIHIGQRGGPRRGHEGEVVQKAGDGDQEEKEYENSVEEEKRV